MSPLAMGNIAKNAACFSIIALNFLTLLLIAVIGDLIKKLLLKHQVRPHGKAVFITGCDSGFGNAFAKRLDSKGFHVFATCLFPTGPGASELKASCSDRLHILQMDVTKDESVKNAFECVRENLGSSELWAIVNNAGITKGFSMEFSSLDDFKDCLDVNLLGYVRVTKAFLPLLKQTKGRIVNITSAAGEIVLPFSSPYVASKFAAVGFTDALRYELDSWGISVVSIQPEVFLTGLTSPEMIKTVDDKLKSLGRSLTDDYDENFASSFRDLGKIFLSLASPEVSIVVNDLESAVSLVHPHHTYKPRRNLLVRFALFGYAALPRSCQILYTKFLYYLFFTENEALESIMKKCLGTLFTTKK